MANHQQQHSNHSMYAPPNPHQQNNHSRYGGRYVHWGQPEYHPPAAAASAYHHHPHQHHHPQATLHRGGPPPPPPPHPGYHHHHHQAPHPPGYGIPPPPPPPPPPMHHHHHAPPYHHGSYLQHPHALLHHSITGSSSCDDDEDEYSHHNMDPIEVLHPEQNLLAPPPELLPPLLHHTTSTVAVEDSNTTTLEMITSPSKSSRRVEEDTSHENTTTNNMSESEQTKFVDQIFGEPGVFHNNTHTATTTTEPFSQTIESNSLEKGVSYDDETTDGPPCMLDGDDSGFLPSFDDGSKVTVYSPGGGIPAVYMAAESRDEEEMVEKQQEEEDPKSEKEESNHTAKDENNPPNQHDEEQKETTTLEENNDAPVGTQGPRLAVMSPITMCFNRMLGAAEFIKTPGSVKPKKRAGNTNRPLPIIQEEERKRVLYEGPNPFDELAEDSELERLVILQMAMQRQQHGNQYHPHGTSLEKEPAVAAPRSQIISEGFFWREYPPCEQVLYTHMNKYYEISAIQRNYKVQQSFNNVLVEEVRQAALNNGFVVDPNFDDKKLRDRIRCFYKTHLQNAKKRLATLQKHSDLAENRALVAVFIRCVRNPSLSFEDSLNMAGGGEADGPSKKQRRLDKVEKLKLSVKLNDTMAKTTATTHTTNNEQEQGGSCCEV